jgi:NhaP-type Na+/H+ or K+/H+ antiporter
MEVGYWFAIVGGLLVLMALIGTVVKRLPLTTSLLYMLVGIILGPLGFGLLVFNPFSYSVALERVTEIAVVISLFTAGLKMRIGFSDNRWRPPVKLATLGMVLTVGLVAALGTGLLGLSLGAAVLLGAILAPTDPVLASDVQVGDPADRDRLRFSLTGEAGLNDGTAFPFVMLGLGLLGLHEIGSFSWRWISIDLVWAVVGGLGIGWILGLIIGRITIFLRNRYKHALGYEDFLALGLIALSYGAALSAHAYGFLAVFAAGLSLRHLEMRMTGADVPPQQIIEDAPETAEDKLATGEDTAPAYLAQSVLNFCEQMERIFELTVVLLIGAMLTYADFSARSLVFAALLFFVARPIAVYLGYHGPGVVRSHRPYVAWFGMRGVGSLYYLFFAIVHGLPEGLARELTGMVLTVVAISIVLHGISVTPIMSRYMRKAEPRANAG